MDPSRKQKWAEHMAKIILHKSQIRAFKPNAKCIKSLTCKYLKILGAYGPEPPSSAQALGVNPFFWVDLSIEWLSEEALHADSGKSQSQ